MSTIGIIILVGSCLVALLLILSLCKSASESDRQIEQFYLREKERKHEEAVEEEIMRRYRERQGKR